jgi:hypothetical protein
MNNLILLTLLLLGFINNAAASQNITYGHITTYLYYTNHLAKSIYYLSLLDKQNYHYKPCNIIKEKNSILIDSTYFFNHKIITCIDKMLLLNRLTPLLVLLNEIIKYEHFENKAFMHELFLLIFTVHKQILFHECDESNTYALKTVTISTIIEISEKINQLPIAEILNAIDMLVTELPPFLEKYEFNSKISWKEWFKKYWWVPPIFSGWFGLKILLSLQKPHFYYSPYLGLTPKPLLTPEPIYTHDAALQEISIV